MSFRRLGNLKKLKFRLFSAEISVRLYRSHNELNFGRYDYPISQLAFLKIQFIEGH